MRYHNIIFDLDGTLTDSAEGIINSAVYAFEQLHLPVPERSEFRKMIGPPLTEGFPLLGVPDALVSEAIRLYRVRYNDRGGKFENRVYDGIADCLKALKAAGFRLYVGTSKPEPMAREILERHGLSQEFAYIAGASWDKSRQSKEDVLRYLLSVIGTKDGAVLVGDTRYDAEGARTVGIPCIGVTWGFGLREELTGTKAVVTSPEALKAYLIEKGE